MFNELIVQEKWVSTIRYGLSVLNPDGSKIWGWSATSTPYTMLAYYDTTDLTYNFSYFAEADVWTLVTESKWRCFLVTEDKAWNFISKTWASWGTFTNLWDETTVKSLTYN